MPDEERDEIREVLFRLLLEMGLLRPVPISLQVLESLNGRSYRILPLAMALPYSCLFYAAQDERLHREVLFILYERKALVDGGFHPKKWFLQQPALSLPPMQDRGWVEPLDRASGGDPWGEQFRPVAARAR